MVIESEWRAVPECGTPFFYDCRNTKTDCPAAATCCTMFSAMETTLNLLPCDGCGLPASPEHIAERVHRLEQSTQFRLIHTGILFIAIAPPASPADDFYGPARSKDFFEPFLEALEIPELAGKNEATEGATSGDLSRLAEFQR